MNTKKLREVLRRLRRDVPTDAPLKVVRRESPYEIGDEMGYCIKVPSGYRIVINSTLCEGLQIEMLLHEYAHALAWTAQEEVGRREQHDSIWGSAYARTFRAFYKWDKDRTP